MTTACQFPLLTDETRRRIRPYCIFAAAAYLGAIGITTIVIVCNLLGVLDSGRFIMVFAVLPVIARYVVVYPISQRIAKITGQQIPKVSLLSYLIAFICLGLLLFLAFR